MRLVLAAFVALHGLVHLIGFAKAVTTLALPLETPVPRALGVLWLASAILFVIGAALLAIDSPSFWLPLLPALLLSQGLIMTVFRDAKFGTIANAIILLPLAFTLLERRPTSFSSTYARDVEQRLPSENARRPFTPAEIDSLPPLFRRYLETVGALSYGHVSNVRVRLRGEIRRSTEARWMRFDAEQYDFFEAPARMFYLRSSMLGMPFDALHVFQDGKATMRARVASLFDVVDGYGPQMDQSETVTLFNDMCIMAPGSLVGAQVRWEELNARELRGNFTNAGQTVSATLSFDPSGELVNFVSDDRFMSADGKRYERYRWSTPVRAYRDFGGIRLASHGDASWSLPSGEFEYARMDLLEVVYNCARARTALAR